MIRSRTRKVLLALVVIVCTLVVSTSAALLAHDHGPGPNTCSLCTVCHMAWLQPAILASLAPPIMREWRELTAHPYSALEPSLTGTPSRAPPA